MTSAPLPVKENRRLGCRNSIDAGDWVLTEAPPYTMFQLDQLRLGDSDGSSRGGAWMPAALPVLTQILRNAGIKTRVSRFYDDPFQYPPALYESCRYFYWRDVSVAEHVESLRRI